MKEKKKSINNKNLKKTVAGIFSRNRYVVITVAASFLLIYASVSYSVYSGNFIGKIRLKGFIAGSKAPRDLVSDRNFVFVDKEATEALIRERTSSALKVFRFDDQKVLEINRKYEDFSKAYISVIENPKSSQDKLKSYLSNVSSIEMDFLLTKVDPYIVIPAVQNIMDSMLLKGIIRIPDNMDLSFDSVIKVWKWNAGRKEFHETKISDLITMGNVDRAIEDRLMYRNFPEKEKYAIHLLVRSFIQEDVYYDPIQTSIALEKIRKNIDPVIVEIKRGEKIIQKGTIVTEKQLEIARAITSGSGNNGMTQLAGGFIFLVMLYGSGFLLFSPVLRKNGKRRNQFAILIMIMFSTYIIYVTGAVRLTETLNGIDTAFFIPASLFTMSVSVIMGISAGGLFSLFLAVSLLLFPSTTIYGFLFILVSGFAGAFFVKKSEKRIDLIKAAMYLMGINVLTVCVIGLFLGHDLNWFVKISFIVMLNASLSGILNLSLLPVLEHIMNLPTAFRLVELSDMSMPIFKRMITLAPGTYGHSMSVANLAESAARDIGADALLARVGAYYHDIGKIDQPEYFIENQKGDNKHDDLKPSLSVAVIKSHVKIGIERAKEMGLPPEIIDIIAQHHGSGVINYFYIEAVKKELDSKRISREDYSYNGVPPQSKEAGIVMLADSVEAASRVLKKPTISKLDKYIWGIILEKVESGQMMNCSLTFKDLVSIKNSFIQILAGHFHSRIEYPKLEEGKT